MPRRPRPQPSYPLWREAVDRVIAAYEARENAAPGTPEWNGANDVYQQAKLALAMIRLP
jgi:hypothetical protein